MHFRRAFRASAAAIVAATALTAAPTAQAEQFDTGLGTMPIGEWGKVRFLTPNDPQFWDPTVTTPRIVSPRGTENLECKAFHGKATGCRQDGVGLRALPLPWEVSLCSRQRLVLTLHNTKNSNAPPLYAF